MAGKEKNNKLIQKNNLIIPEGEQAVKKRGRPKGSKNSHKVIRKDNIQSPVYDEVRQKILEFNMQLFHLPKILDYNDLQAVQNRTNLFFELCIQYNVSPTLAGYSFSFGISRGTLYNWLNGKTESIKNKECLNILKNAYDFINNSYEQLLTEGKIIPVSAFFLLQNNYGYKQQTDHVITANTPDNVTDDDIMNKAGLIE